MKHSSAQFYGLHGPQENETFLSGELPSNYHLTFFVRKLIARLPKLVLEIGGNVAVVFIDQLPQTWNGFEVVNGDESDSFLDKQGVVVGLIEKGLQEDGRALYCFLIISALESSP